MSGLQEFAPSQKKGFETEKKRKKNRKKQKNLKTEKHVSCKNLQFHKREVLEHRGRVA